MKTLTKRVSIYVSLLMMAATVFSGLLSLFPATAAAVTPQFCQQNGQSYDPTTQTCTSPTSSTPPPQAPFWTLSVPQQAEVWTELAALDSGQCTLPSGRGAQNSTIDPSKPSTWYTGTADVGTHVDPSDGRLDCDDESGWITNLLNVAGYGGGHYSEARNKAGASPKAMHDLLSKGIFGLAGPPSTIPPQLKYWILFQAFIANKQDTACDAHTDPGTPDGRLKYENGPVDIWVAQGGEIASVPYMYNHKTDTTTVGWDVRSGASTYSCGAIASVLSSSHEGLQLAQAFANNDSGDNPAVPGGSDEANADTGCDLNGDPFTWFVCPVVDSLEHMIQKVDNFITESLTFNTKDFFEDNAGYKAAWNSFRILATGILVIAGLVMIASQALGLEILDAYTIKKVLPRLLIAIIGITLSWPLTRYAVDFFNVLGTDIRNLIYSPFSNLSGNIGAGAAAVLAGGGAIGIWALGPIGILSFLATAALAVLVGFIIIMVRYLALIVIIIFAPIAIAAYILPNTQKLWNLWKDNFLGLLLVFPIISAFIAIGKVFSAVSLSGNGPIGPQGTSTTGASTVMQIVGLAAYFLPYFLLPIAFRLATGAIGAIAGFVNDRHRGAFDRLKGYRKNAYETHGGVRVHRAQGKALQARYKAYKGLGEISKNSNSRVGKFLAHGAQGAVGGFNIEERISAHNAEMAKKMGDQTSNGPDRSVRAYTANKARGDTAYAAWQAERARNDTSELGQRRLQQLRAEAEDWVAFGDADELAGYKTAGGATVTAADIAASERAYGKNNHAAYQQALTYEMGKATTQEEQDHLVRTSGVTAAQRHHMGKDEWDEAWIGAAYAKQNQNLQLKHIKWDQDKNGKYVAKLNGGALITETDEKLSTYGLQNMSAEQWVSMAEGMQEAHSIVMGNGPALDVKRIENETDAAYWQRVGNLENKRKEKAEDTLRRGARIASSEEFAAMVGQQATDADQKPTGQVLGGRQVGSGAAGRVMKAMQEYANIAGQTAGIKQGAGTPDYRYQAPKPQTSGPNNTPTTEELGRRNWGNRA